MSGLRLKTRRNFIISIVIIVVLYIVGCCLIVPLCSDKTIQNEKVVLSQNTNERVRIVDDNIPMSLKQKVSAIMLELLLNPFSYVL